MSSAATSPNAGNLLDEQSSMPRPSSSSASLTAGAVSDDDDDVPSEEQGLGYQQTLMYGRYTRDLGEYIKAEARRLKRLEKQRKKEEKLRTKELRKYRGKWTTRFLNAVGFVWRNTFARLGEDWVFLAILGFIMAIISFCVEYSVGLCNKARLWLYRDLSTHPFLQFLAWVSFPLFLILFSVGFTHIVARQATGSGIPEMKTILRGVALKEYLTFRTLVAKVVGLTATLGAGMPLGKEGPFVHIASIVATLLSKLVTSFKGIYENERRNSEMLAAACAVGVACTFYSPIGGVLFSIEVTAVYFAVRNYWRGFFAAVNAALIFRLLGIWLKEEATITALFATHFASNFPFDPQELVVFSLMGVFCGFSGAFWVWLHRRYVKFIRKSKRMKRFLERNRFLYPGVVALTISALTCPLSLGQFMAGELTTHGQVDSLFANFTFVVEDVDMLEIDQRKVRGYWATPNSNVFLSLFIFFVMTGIMTIPASTMPVPSGIFIPMFKMGAAFGRLVGEAMAVWFPQGVRYGSFISTIQPGGYAVVGAAAFSGAVTHTLSTSVIVFEVTGQITHVLPVMIAVLIANAIAQLLQPSIYDSMIQIKKLPYLPDILSSKSAAYSICVEDFMMRNVKYIWYKMTFRELREVLRDSKKLRSLPIVDAKDSMILLGSIHRLELVRALEKHIGRERRMKAAARWHSMAQKALLESKVKEFAQSREGMSASNSAADADSISSATRLRSGEDDDERGDVGLELVTRPTLAIAGVSDDNKLKPGTSADAGERRPSRFEVVPATTAGAGDDEARMASKRQQHATDLLMEFSVNKDYSASNSLPPPGMQRPIKSILKKTPSFHFPSGSPQETYDERRMAMSVKNSPYGTMDSTRMKKAMDVWKALGRAASQLSGLDKGPYGTWTPKRVQLPTERVIDLPPEEQRKWEEKELSSEVDFSVIPVDPAPFQLVEKTTLLKVHSLFSLLSLKLAYVTALGKLIGVVALRDLRQAIEGVNAGHFTATPTQPLLPPLTKPATANGTGGSKSDGGATTDDDDDEDDDNGLGKDAQEDKPSSSSTPGTSGESGSSRKKPADVEAADESNATTESPSSDDKKGSKLTIESEESGNSGERKRKLQNKKSPSPQPPKDEE